MNYNEIMLSIMTGEQDEWLDNIAALVHNRKREMAPKIWEFQIGDAIRMVNTNPKYLNGATGKVRKVNRTKVVIDLDEQHGRFFRNISTPLSMIEKV
jgi:uncharacterized protein YkvS